jgi:hypothetical protein
MQFFRETKTMTLRALGAATLAVPFLFICSHLAQASSLDKEASATPAEFAASLRWGRQGPDSESMEITTALSTIFQQQANDINFSKRGLTSLLEQGLPRQLGRLFPFRRMHQVPAQFFFENFAPVAFLVGELNTRVPPILAETDTAEWLELKSRDPIPPARELNPPLPVAQGLRTLSLQNPWASEIFSAAWSNYFESAAAIVENGGLNCLRKSLKKNDVGSQTLPAHFRCSTPLQALSKDNGIPKLLPRKLGPLTVPQNNTAPTSAVQPTCIPMGRMNMQALELLGDEKAGHCLLWRASKDERFQQRSFSSKLICLNARHKSFQRTRFNSVVAVLPSSRPDALHILESEDGLITAHRLSLATLSIGKEEITTNSGQNLRNATFPQNRNGLYACQQPSAPSAQPFPSTETLGANVEWVYLDDSVYSGLRAVRPETDVAWRLKETSDSSIDVERLNWSQLSYDHPSITADRTFACSAARDIDAKCGIRVLQTALQISEEWLSGEFDRSEFPIQVQLSATLLVAQALEKTMLTLPEWALREETETLLGFFRKKSQALSENRAFAGNAPRIERNGKAIPTARRYLDIPRDSQEYLTIKNSISSAGDFWALLKQKPL